MRNLVSRFYFSLSKFDSSKDYYSILSVHRNASQQQIKKQFIKLAKSHHPDLVKGKEQFFKEINQAHQVLSSEQTRKSYDESRKSQSSSQHANTNYRSQQNTHQSAYRRAEQEYDQSNPAKFREFLRRKHEQQMKRYTQQRANYDDLGKTYDNYDRFRQESLKKKKQKYQQQTKVTQQSVNRQEQIYREASNRRAQVERQKRMHQIKNDMLYRASRGAKNLQNTISGIKEMGNMVKDFFKKK